jgi:hypothetical protein
MQEIIFAPYFVDVQPIFVFQPQSHAAERLHSHDNEGAPLHSIT